jgi:acyl-CoA dehydrogenase
MFSFALTDEQQAILTQVKRFAAEHVRPVLRASEEACGVPRDLRARYHELGLLLLEYPTAVGGLGLGMFTRVLLDEALAHGDVGIAHGLGGPGHAGYAVLELGTSAQAERLLGMFAGAAGAERYGALAIAEEPLGIRIAETATVATPVKGGFRLDGRKRLVDHGGLAEVYVVIARSSGAPELPGHEPFVVHGNTPGLHASPPLDKLGLRTVVTADLVLDGCVVSESERLCGAPVVPGLSRVLQRIHLRTAAAAVGLARAASEYAAAYALERQTFGRPIAEHQAIAFLMAEMAMQVEAARNLVWRAAWCFDTDQADADAEVAMALVHATRAAGSVTENAVQLLGGHGYMQDHPVEKWMRDAKALALSWGTAESTSWKVGRRALGVPC